MEESRKRAGLESDGDAVRKRPRAPVMAEENCEDDEEEEKDTLAWLSMDEEKAGELMKLLDDDVLSPSSRVKFIHDPCSSPLLFQSSSSYVTINGNEETCGSSFSDWEASVMASIDTGGVDVAALSGWKVGLPAAEGGGALGFLEGDERPRLWRREGGEMSGGTGINGHNDVGCEWDDDMLARFLGDDCF